MWDVFISHAWEDKDEVARPLAQALSQAGLKVWFDEATLTLGDSLRRSIDRGLAQSRYGIVILSPHFFAKEWPQRELDGLFTRDSDAEKVILPVWHKVNFDEVKRHSPILASKLSVSTDRGMAMVVTEILRVVKPGAAPPPAPVDSASGPLECVYLEQARNSYRYVKFRGLPRSKGEGVEPPRLDQAYVSLRMSSFRVEREPGAARRGKAEPGEVLESGVHQQADPVDLVAAIQESPRLAIIGAAGSGKSTLLQWAGLACANARLGKSRELSADQRKLLKILGKREPPFPLLIPLRAFNNYCHKQGKPHSPRALLEFISEHFSQKHSVQDFPPDFFEGQLKRSCLLMLDGVDEVDPDDRASVQAAVEQFLSEYEHPLLRCLITSRYSAAYVSDQMVGFRRCDVQPLTPEQRDRLIELWYCAVLAGDEASARQQAARLSREITSSDPRVRDLAITPLMVTIFAMVHYSRNTLPPQRAKLYEDAVEVILSEPYKDEGPASGQDWEASRDRLMPIAFTLQEQGVESLLEGDLVDLIWQDFDLDKGKGRKAARNFLVAIADRGGLLEERDGLYGFFTHATFREYLAGRHICEAFSDEEQRLFLAVRLEDDRWEEAIQLAAGYLAIRAAEGANRFVRTLAGLGETDAQRTRALLLVDQSLADMKAERRKPDTVSLLTQSTLPFITADPPCVGAALRRRLGLALGALGDPRLDPHNPEMLPVPAGPFRMGSSPQDEERLAAQGAKVWDDEKPDHRVELSEFWIGKYPLTNFEYRAFWGAGGYAEPRYWSEEGWLWRNGQWESDLSGYSDEIRDSVRRWLEGRTRRDQPYFWDALDWNAPNLPVVGVCWFEAQAYCNWLSAVTGRRYSLPSEAQWEKAARGAQSCLWPWGDEWDGARCNSGESPESIGSTTPVGMYSQGGSPYGARDMAGNVWEWCQDWYDEGEYARRAGSQVVDPQGPQSVSRRVVRGGSWDVSRHYARGAFRYWFAPDLFNISLGFRLVLSPS